MPDFFNSDNHRFEKIFKFFRDNLAWVLLLPAVLGGLWQIIELTKMSTSYIRFFSATQLLPDGLMILFILLMQYFAFKIGVAGSQNNPKNNICKNGGILKCLLAFTFEIIILLFILWILKTEHINFSIFIFFTFIITSTMISLAKKLSILFVLLSKKEKMKLALSFIPNTIKHDILNDNSIIISTIAIFLFAMPFYLFPLFHNTFLLPYDLKNLEYIQKELKSQEFKSSKISYFNDKYIFIEHTKNDGNKSIEILKFDDLFKE